MPTTSSTQLNSPAHSQLHQSAHLDVLTQTIATSSLRIFEDIKQYIQQTIDNRFDQLNLRINQVEEKIARVYGKIPVSNGFSQAKIDRAKRLNIDLTVELV